jgi:3D-(3,5/4)-trihydroxycyclohexane-1,2-dione acylhydrolase (decyclizing)
VDLAANAASLGACVIRAAGLAALDAALAEARSMDRTVVIHVEADREVRVGSYEAWWDVPVAEVSDDQAVRAARREYEQGRAAERWHL